MITDVWAQDSTFKYDYIAIIVVQMMAKSSVYGEYINC